MANKNPLVIAEGLTKTFSDSSSKRLPAVNNFSLVINEGETVGLVGESGCGKSTTGKLILRLLEASSGSVSFAGKNLGELCHRELKALRREMQIIFQDPYASLNPRMTVKEIVGEPFEIHRLVKRAHRQERIAELLNLVGLDPSLMGRFPHEFSGGQRQRIGIARALAVEPRFIVCDEPISALDVSVQAQIINLLRDLQKDLNLTYLFISHDLAMVEYIADRVAVMFAGSIVEIADNEPLYGEPLHPYTQALLAAIPNPDPDNPALSVTGEGSSETIAITGCPYSNRCPLATEKCRQQRPILEEKSPGHWVACYHN